MQPETGAPERLGVEAILSREQAAVRARLEPLWQQVSSALEEGFSSLAISLQALFEQALKQERERARLAARRELISALEEALRRLRQAGDAVEWSAALLDAASAFCQRAVLLWVHRETLQAGEAIGFEPELRSRLAGLRIHLTQAPALRAALESAEPVVTQRCARELSEALAAIVGDSEQARAWLFPLQAQTEAEVVLYADGEPASLDVAGIELVTLAAGLPQKSAWPAPAQMPQARLPGEPPRELPEWSQLSRQDQELHLRARRFARAQVAEMRLYKPRAVEAGRAQRELYKVLKPEIDAAREAFLKQFVDLSPTMVDYLHQELVRTLALDDASLLGEDYPGPLV